MRKRGEGGLRRNVPVGVNMSAVCFLIPIDFALQSNFVCFF